MRFVPPRTVQTAKDDAAIIPNAEMQVCNRFCEIGVNIVIAFYGENA
jgi:hypothetical protein